MKLLKNLLIGLVFAFGLGAPAFAQVPAPAPLPSPGTGDSFVYTNANGHSVPYQIYFAQNGLVYAVFDPSVSAADFSACFAFLQSYNAATETNGAKILPWVVGNQISTNFLVQETRTVVPFTVANSTTLQTVPFSQPVVLQANGHYRFEVHLYLSAFNGGSKFDVGGTCNTSNFVAEYRGYSSTVILYGGQVTSFLSGPSGSNTTGATEITITGELDVTNGGTFVVQFAQNQSNATGSTVLAGSTFTVTQIP